MKKTWAFLVGLVLAGTLAAAQLPGPQFREVKERAPQTRALTGFVSDQHGSPLSDSVVYLTNTRTMGVKTYIVGKDGMYRFPALSPNIDYQVYAQYKNHKSDTKTLSSFDSRPNAVINLRVEMK
ncbi:MAG TPA: carboxypeptidase-like regulatory domain-containing protein [Terriglobales bacterium]|nr:carboxypeptidase-like regulatory domain-containing protein [Terriglobales bacterium]